MKYRLVKGLVMALRLHWYNIRSDAYDFITSYYINNLNMMVDVVREVNTYNGDG